MVTKVEFGSRDKANEVRDKIEAYRAAGDSRTTKTIFLTDDTPDSVVERVSSEGLGSQTSDRESYGKAKLTKSEKETLRRTTNFQWQQHGFEAMAAKAALKAKGADTWTDYYEPGEGVDSSLSKLRAAKGGAQTSRASIGIEGMRQDEAESGNMGRRSRQVERSNAARAKSAKGPALLEQDADAIAFLREEEQFSDDVYDIMFSRSGGQLQGGGRDFERLEERHQQRSERAQRVDERRSAKPTRDPIQWAQNPAQYDYPGIDTVQPQELHEQRSERAQEADERELAPPADTKEQWANNQDEYDWPGVDTPPGMALGPQQKMPEDVPEPTQRPSAALAVQEGPTGREAMRSLMGQLQERDVSVSPDELAGNVATQGYAEVDKFPNIPIQSRGGRFDMAPDEEQEEIDDIAGSLMSNFTDDRDEEGQLTDFGMETDATQHRESRKEGEKATTFGVDDRESATMGAENEPDSGEQGGLERFGGGARENETLF